MRANVVEIQALIEGDFDGNKARLAYAIGVTRSHVSKVLSSGKAGGKFIGGLMAYCKEKNLNHEKFFFLPNNVKKVNYKQKVC